MQCTASHSACSTQLRRLLPTFSRVLSRPSSSHMVCSTQRSSSHSTPLKQSASRFCVSHDIFHGLGSQPPHEHDDLLVTVVVLHRVAFDDASVRAPCALVIAVRGVVVLPQLQLMMGPFLSLSSAPQHR